MLNNTLGNNFMNKSRVNEKLMNKRLNPLLASGLLVSVMLMTACAPKDNSQQNNGSEPKDASQEVIEQLKTKPIKTFPSTPDDAHDIQLFDEYQQKFTENSRALEIDLKKRASEGNLTAEIDHQLKRDSIESALNMLKELDLKTEQGRYIQGLYYQYWENQAKIYDEKKQSTNGEIKNSSDSEQDMSDIFSVDAQLEHWKSTTAKS